MIIRLSPIGLIVDPLQIETSKGEVRVGPAPIASHFWRIDAAFVKAKNRSDAGKLGQEVAGQSISARPKPKALLQMVVGGNLRAAPVKRDEPAYGDDSGDGQRQSKHP